jgi:hypothetical protein
VNEPVPPHQALTFPGTLTVGLLLTATEIHNSDVFVKRRRRANPATHWIHADFRTVGSLQVDISFKKRRDSTTGLTRTTGAIMNLIAKSYTTSARHHA